MTWMRRRPKKILYITKYDATSPTIAIESVFLTSIIDVDEKHDVSTAGILGAYLHAKIDDHVIVRFDGTMAEILERIAPAMYRPYIQARATGKPVLYAKFKKPCTGA